LNPIRNKGFGYHNQGSSVSGPQYWSVMISHLIEQEAMRNKIILSGWNQVSKVKNFIGSC